MGKKTFRVRAICEVDIEECTDEEEAKYEFLKIMGSERVANLDFTFDEVKEND